MIRTARLVFFLLLFGVAVTTEGCRCGDPCDGVTCATGEVCEDGVCVSNPDGGGESCFSDFDCAGKVGRTHCDGISQTCVACLFAAHCPDPQTQICESSNHTCVARPPCATDDSCADLPATPRCEVVSGACVSCLVDDDCPGSQQGCHPTGYFCRFEPCSADADCASQPDEPYCHAATGLCQQCTGDAHCGADEVCRDGLCQARGECVRNTDCGPGQVCDTSGLATCVQCSVDLDCRLGGVCTSRSCQGSTSCTGDVDCDAPRHCQLALGLCVECLDNAHCRAGQTCAADGTCSAPATCSSSALCLEGQSCVSGQCRAATCSDDDLEPNDTPYGASPILPGVTAGRTLCPNDRDWYVADAAVGDGVLVELAYDRSGGDPTLLVWAGTGSGPVLAGQAAFTATGQKVEIPSLSRSGPLWIGVRGINAEVGYDLSLTVDPDGLCDDDALEPNDSSGLPTNMPLPLAGRSELDATACFADEDWFALDVPAGQRLLAEAAPLGGASAGNLMLSIFVQTAGGNLQLVGGTGANTAEAPAAGADRILLIRVSQVVPGATDYHLVGWIRPPRPANDGCSGAPLLTDGATVTATTGGGTDDGQTLCGGAGSADVVFRLDLPTDRLVTLSTTGALDTVLGLRTTCADPASELACNDVPGSLEQLTALLPAGAYTVWVDGYGGAEGSFDLSLTTADPPPPPANEDCSSAILLDESLGGGSESGDLSTALRDLAVSCGQSGGDAVYRLPLSTDASLSLQLAGAPGLSVSVRSTCADDGTEADCAAVAADGGPGLLDLPFLAAGDWTVVVSGGGPAGGLYDLSWALGSPIPPATNEDCSTPEPLVFTADQASVAGDTRNAAEDLDAACALPGQSGGDVLYSFALLSPRSVSASLGAAFDGVLALRAMPCADAGSALSCSDLQTPTLFEPELPGGLYYLIVDGYDGAAGPFTLDVSLGAPLPPPANDTCAAAEVVSVAGGTATVTGHTYRGSDTLDPVGCLSFAQPGPEVFFAVDLLAGQTLTATATPEAGHDLSIYLLSGCDPNACLAGADDSFISLPETVSHTVAVNQTLWVVVDSWSATSEGRFTLELTVQ
ncbi:MAG: hypothetical protein P1V51_15255 [Deltaproteobacteria bacterium]|nr:hypothetical protein [Deltaproteobacteria bacterium]